MNITLGNLLLEEGNLFFHLAIWKLRLYTICTVPSVPSVTLAEHLECHVTRTSPASAVVEKRKRISLTLPKSLRLSDNRWRKTLSSKESKIFNDSRHSRRKRGP
ncbi:hypothetical protein CDAR_75131 [Caerostris darwini]|uniref:Uncharacterized protein n=1 Tax=Caerostris darwini TaxID=1538125 RepID=A0AAV4MRT5_9ARAC|nr:hypothetical protein CDAR_75131 [Caerostris darwini]